MKFLDQFVLKHTEFIFFYVVNNVINVLYYPLLGMELYKDYRELGRFMLRSGGTTIAAGLVTNIK